MKKTFLFVLLCLPFCLLAQAQFDPAPQLNQFTTQLASRTGNMPIFDLGYDNIKGSAYVIDQYCDGTVWMTKNRQFTEGYQFKYDETQNVVRAKNLKTGLELELLKEEVLGLKLIYKSHFLLFITMDIPENEKGEKCLLQVIFHSSKYSLMKRPSKSLEKVKHEAHTQEENYSIFKASPDYYFRTNENAYQKIKFSKKGFTTQLTAKKTELDKLFDLPENKGTLTDFKIAKILQTLDGQSGM
jgi:hypothetical protein